MNIYPTSFTEVGLEYRNKRYIVSKYFILHNYRLCELREPITGIDEGGYLVSKSSDLHLKNKPIGLFRFDNMNGYIDCISVYDENEVINIRLKDYFYNHTHFFVLEG